MGCKRGCLSIIAYCFFYSLVCANAYASFLANEQELVKAAVRMNNGLYTFEYTLKFPADIEVQHFSIDISQSGETKPVMDAGLPVGKCGIDFAYSAWQKNAEIVRDGALLLFSAIDPVQAILQKRNGGAKKELYYAELATWLQPLQKQKDDIVKGLQLVNQVQTDIGLSGRFEHLVEIYQQEVLDIQNNAAILEQNFNQLMEINSESESIRDMAYLVEAVASKALVLEERARMLMRLVWNNRALIPSSILWRGDDSIGRWGCEISRQEAVWANQGLSATTQSGFILQSYGQPVIRQYTIRYVRKGNKFPEEFLSWTIGPGAVAVKQTWQENIASIIHSIHLSYWSGWINDAKKADRLVAQLNHISLNVLNGEKLAARSGLENILKYLEQSKCTNKKLCHLRSFSEESFWVLSHALNVLLSRINGQRSTDWRI